PISAVDVARAVSVVLDNPAPHIGQIYNLTGFESADLEHYARVFSEALGRTIRYRDVPLSGWSEKLLEAGVPAHTVKHLCVMTELTKQGRYDRMTQDLLKLTGQKPLSMYDFVKLHGAEFTREAIADRAAIICAVVRSPLEPPWKRLRLFPGRTKSALVDSFVVDECVILSLHPTPRRLIILAGRRSMATHSIVAAALIGRLM